MCIPAQAINLGDDELSAVKPASLDSLSQDGPVRLLPTLDLDELLDELAIAAVEEVIDSPALRFSPRPLRPCRPVLTRKYDTHLPSAMTASHDVTW